MNKKRYIPLVVIGALILSLIAIFPAFGAGDAGFVASGDISKSDPDRLDYSRQGGDFGLYLDDSSLDVPVRRVLIPELDAEMVGTTSVTAHSDMVDTTTGAGVVLGNYVIIGDHNVRKVTGVATATPVPDNSMTNWYLEQGAGADDAGTALASPVTTDITGLPGFTLAADGDGFDAGENITLTIGWVADPITAAYPTDLDIDANTDTDANDDLSAFTAAESTATILAVDHTGTVAISASGFVSGTADKGMHTLTFTASQGTGDDEITATHTLAISIYDLDDGIVKLTLDRPFAESTDDEMTENLYVINEEDILDDSSWDDDFGMYAMATEVQSATTDDRVRAAGDFFRWRGEHLVVSSNILTDDPPSPAEITATTRTVGDAQQRIAGSESGRVSSNDALVVRLSGDNAGDTTVWTINRTDGEAIAVDDVDDEDVIFSPAAVDTDADGSGTGVKTYIVAWFDEPNDTGGTVTVRSQAYQTETVLVMMETGDESGKFAMVIQAVEFDGDDNEDLASGATGTADDDGDMMYDMTVTSGAMPMVPVNPRDTITLESSDSRASLSVETTPPTFTGLSPANNFAGSDNRPTVSGQVTDGDSGLSEGAIDILFRVVEKGASPVGDAETVNPKDDADSDDISGGFAVSGRLGDKLSSVVPDDDATIYWWIRATDKAGNVGFSDQSPTNGDGDPDPCEAQALTKADNPNPTIVELERAGCQPYVILLDSTEPKMLRAETGRHWNSALRTGDGKDKTEYRVTKADATSVLVIFDEALDATTVSASDFEVSGATPADASPYNVKVRAASDDEVTNYAGYDAGRDSVADADRRLGYVFLRLSAELKADAEPKVELVGDVLDLAGNEQDKGVDNDALDRIAPTLTVTIDEGSRPSTMNKVNLTITADENIGSPTIDVVQVFSYDGDAMVTGNSDSGSATVKFVSATEYSAEVSAGNADGLYSVHVEATDAAGGNVGMTGDMMGDVDVDDDTTAILFEHDSNIGYPDVDPDKAGVQDSFETDDMNGYIRIDFSAEAREYDNAMYDHDMDAETDEIMGDDLDTHAGITIVSATLNGDDIAAALQSNDAGNVFLYRAPDGLTVGEHKLEVIAMDDAGNKHAVARKATIEITERKPFSLKLNPGWNLVSIPGEPADPDINVVIPADRTDITSVLAYDPTVPGLWLSASRGADGMFSGTLKNITSTRGYWVETNTFTALKVMIPKQSPGQARVLPTIPVAKGWNMVPIIDVDGDFKLDDDDKLPTMGNMDEGTRGYLDGLEGVRAYTFNTITNRWDLVSEVQIGKGYWVYVSKAGIIVP